MILLDVNLLLYAQFPDYPKHELARTWFEARLNGTTQVGLPWVTVLGFVRIASNPRLFAEPPTVLEAWRVVRGWLECSTVWIPEPTSQHSAVFQRMLEAAPLPRLVTDAYLAALAVEHGLTLCSADADFARFPELRFLNPLPV
ncbi:MAG: PIN domain-containing protein [Deltaproteobacteria bacterium]|nr:PIN domain-containing protein [Deltaproteobacteria bacterium]